MIREIRAEVGPNSSSTSVSPVPPATSDTIDAVGVALDALGALGRSDVDIAAMTTYRVGGTADVFVEASCLDDLAVVRRAVAASGLPVLVLGRGSNLLVADAGFRGIAVAMGKWADRIEIDGDRYVVSADAGVLLPVLARRTAAAGLSGFEWAVGVPGTVGGAVRMNAGGHGSDMAACVIDVEIVSLRNGDTAVRDGAAAEGFVRTVPLADLELGFRSSGLDATDVVVGARLQLAPGDPAASKALLDDVVAWRRAHQPGGQNAGSVFVNPVPGKVSAGLLIDQLGLRGFRIGTAEVSTKHANFIQADDGGTAADVMAVMRTVRNAVRDATGYELRSEIRLIGFDGDAGGGP